MDKEMENCITNGSVNSCERNDDKLYVAFGTHSNISAVAKHNDEDYAYSSVEGMAVEILNKHKFHESISKFENKQNRYNDSFGK